MKRNLIFLLKYLLYQKPKIPPPPPSLQALNYFQYFRFWYQFLSIAACLVRIWEIINFEIFGVFLILLERKCDLYYPLLFPKKPIFLTIFHTIIVNHTILSLFFLHSKIPIKKYIGIGEHAEMCEFIHRTISNSVMTDAGYCFEGR